MREKVSAPSQDGQTIAIIGIGCRYPGTSDTNSLWELLKNGKSSIQEIPAHRFGPVDDIYDPRPATPGRMMTRYGGFLENIERFDADFFGVSPLEARQLDPQQRVLLEVAWEALEDAGIPADRLAGSTSGVFIGSWLQDFESRLIGDPLVDDLRKVDFYTTTGSGRYTLAGRISYFFGLQGPSFVVDTACSSSLVAIHLACRSLQQGDCDVALTGGVNIILTPCMTVAYSQSRMMAPDGRCKFGDAAADGYVRSEGCGLLVLKRYSKALEDGDFIYAVIRGSAMNNDGNTGGYLATPCKEGQVNVLRKAYHDAGISPNLVKYIEAHGTGTSAGDPVELGALGEVLSEGRSRNEPCLVGSIKTNLGHTEGAAGVAGVIKTALALSNREIPASLNFIEPNPKFSWDTNPLKIPTRTTPWPSGKETLIAGVSGFGIAGTNVHIVLSEAPTVSSMTDTRSLAQGHVKNKWIFPFSAHSIKALREMAGRLYTWRAEIEEEIPLDDLCATAALKRGQLDYRAAIVAGTSEQLQERLSTFAGGETRKGIVFRGDRVRSEGKLAFVYSGQGSQWLGMGRNLMEHSEVFRKALLRCEKVLEPIIGWSLMEQLNASENDSRLNHTSVLQPLLFAVHVALTAQWRAWGVIPDAVIGHSMGEPAAAHAAGALDLESAAKIIALRSRLMERAGGQGAMAQVELSMEEAFSEIRRYGEKLSIAGSNSPRATVLSGDPATLAELLGELERRSVFCRKINMNVACHSPQMDPLRGELVEALAGLAPQPASIPIYSTVYGARLDGNAFDAGYWGENLRQPVKFSETIGEMLKDDHTIFIEMSPHPILLRAIDECAGVDTSGTGGHCVTLPSLVRGEDESAMILESLGELYSLGHPFDWYGLYKQPDRRVTLPTYTWQRERHWFEETSGRVRSKRSSSVRGDGRRRHALLENYINSSIHNELNLWESELDTQRLPWLEDHRIQNHMVFPAAAFIETAVAAAEEVLNTPVELRDIEISEALISDDKTAKRLQVVFDKEHNGQSVIQFYSRPSDLKGVRKPWRRHVRCLVNATNSGQKAPLIDVEAVRAHCDGVITGDRHYAMMKRLKLNYGPAFQGIERIDLGKSEAVAKISSPRNIAADSHDFQIHPALLDAALQLLVSMASRGDEADRAGGWMPIKVEKVRMFSSQMVPDELWSVCRIREDKDRQDDVYCGDISLLDTDGNVLADLRGVVLKKIAYSLSENVDQLLYELIWIPKPLPSDHSEGRGIQADTEDIREEVLATPLPKELISDNETAVFNRNESALFDQSVVIAREPKQTTLSPANQEQLRDRVTWLIFADKGGMGEAIAGVLRHRGDRCQLVHRGSVFERDAKGSRVMDPMNPAHYSRILNALDGMESKDRHAILYLWPLDLPTREDHSVNQLKDIQEVMCSPLLLLVQAMAGNDSEQRRKLWVVNRLGIPTGLERVDLSLSVAALTGLIKVINLEHPELHCRMVDIDGGDRNDLLRHLLEEISKIDAESMTAYRDNLRFVPRLVPFDTDSRGDGEWLQIPKGVPARIVNDSRGTLDGLRWRTPEHVPPGPGKVEIQVRAAGLNFRDVVSALGMIENDDDPGLECAGEVVGVGEGVIGLSVGDEVIAAAPGAFSTIVHADAALALPKPDGLTFEQAATIPIAFLTAWHALIELAELKAGERVLIHAASGGVGMAAVQIAKARGAIIFGSAGTPRKRALLTDLGVDYALDSRSLDFVARIETITAGKGVHVVLNSLSGEFIEKGFEVLQQGGRFIEIGKQDIWSPEKARHQRPDAFYRFFDLAGMIADEPDRVGSMMEQLLERFRTGELKPLPATVWPMEQIGPAYRTMQRAAHIGKIVLNLPRWCGSRSIDAPDAFRKDATYLITGGLGGIGLRLAKWLFERGARHFALIGRNQPDMTAAAYIAKMEADGAHVHVAACDIASIEKVERFFSKELTRMPPLRGVFHLAGTLDDGALIQQNWSRFERVFTSKVLGGWNLHRLTRHKTLDCFVLFSSWASILGSQGQANYSSANAFLDALAWRRRAAGLPGLSINWGAWAEIGLAASADVAEKLSRRGIGSFAPDTGLLALGRLMSQGRVQAAVTPFDLNKWRQTGQAEQRSTWFELLDNIAAAVEKGPDSDEPAAALAEALLAAQGGKPRLLIMEAFLKEQVAKTLRLPITRIDPDRAFNSLGMDSLTALEFRNRIETGINATLSATLVWNYPTINKLIPFLFDKMSISIDQQSETSQSSAADINGDEALLDMLDEIENLPEKEVPKLLKGEK